MVTPPCGKRLEIGLEFVLSLVVGIHEQLELLAVEMVAQKQRAGVGLVLREELLRQLGGLGEVTRLGSFGGLEKQLL